MMIDIPTHPRKVHTAILQFLVLLAGWSGTVTAAWAEDIGLDLILLIDVSRSMYTKSSQYATDNLPDGSDPDRVRWDAVKLVLDLMSANDRIAVLTFNEECPARYHGVQDGKRIPYELFTGGRKDGNKRDAKLRFDADSQGFRPELRRPYELLPRTSGAAITHGQQLIDATRLHNTDDDFLRMQLDKQPEQFVANGLDVGTTNIRAALELAQKLFQSAKSRESTARQPHVILLTDGLDDELKPIRNRDRIGNEQKWKQHIDQWIEARAAPFRGGHGTPVKVHTLGLNLSSLDADEQVPARRLLQQLSFKTQGVNRCVNSARDLIPFFRDLIRDVRGYWSQEFHFDAGQPIIEKIPLGKRLKDVTVMTYGEPSQTASKQSLRAPSGQPGGWIGATDKAALPNPETAFGKEMGANRGLYRLDRFAPTASRRELPFAKTAWPVEDAVPYQIDVDRQDYPQSMIVFKAPLQEPFELLENRPEWKRYDSGFRVAVRLADDPAYPPEDFRVTVQYRVLSADAGTPSPTATHDCETEAIAAPSLRIFELKPSPDKPRLFVAPICLDELLPARMGGPEHIEFTVSIEGLSQHLHLLQSMRRTMLPVQITVQDDSLELKASSPKILLTNAQASQKLRILSSAGCLFHRPKVRVQFTPPQPEQGERLIARDFVFRGEGLTSECEAELSAEGLTLELGLLEDRSGYQRIPHRAGSLKLEQHDGDQWKPRLSIPVELVLQRIPVQFSANPSPLVAASEPVRTKPVTILPVNEDDRQLQRPVEIVLEALPVDETAAVETAPTWKPAKFAVPQLWLQPAADEAAALPESRRQRLSLALGEAFCVWFHPTDRPDLGRYRYQIRTTGSEIGSTQAAGDLDVGPPKVEVVDATPIELFGDPGEGRETMIDPLSGKVTVRLRDALLTTTQDVVFQGDDPAEPEQILCVPTLDGKPIVGQPAERFRLLGPMEEQPAMLAGPREEGLEAEPATIAFQLIPPEGIRVGEYSGTLHITGPAIAPQTVKLRVMIDRLILELPSLDRDHPGWMRWSTDDSTTVDGATGTLPAQFVQFEDRPGRRRVRVSRESGRPLDKAHIFAEFRGALTSKGDVQPEPPSLMGDFVQDKHAVIVTVQFPAVTHFNADRQPYTVPFAVQPKLAAAQSGACPPFRKAERVFEVQYIRLQDLFSTASP